MYECIDVLHVCMYRMYAGTVCMYGICKCDLFSLLLGELTTLGRFAGGMSVDLQLSRYVCMYACTVCIYHKRVLLYVCMYERNTSAPIFYVCMYVLYLLVYIRMYVCIRLSICMYLMYLIYVCMYVCMYVG